MRNNELIFVKHSHGRYTAHLCNKDRSYGFCRYGSGIGNNRLFAFFDLCKDLLFFGHLKEILFINKVIKLS